VPTSHLPKANTAVLYGLMARELGPRDEEGRSLIDDLFNPWPDLSEVSDDVWSDYTHAKAKVLYEVYGGFEGLEEKVADACANNNCNNSWLSGDYWGDYSGEARWFIGGSLLKVKREESPFGYFLKEVGADPSYLPNYEPWWLWQLMQQYPQELLIAQGKWVMEVYLADPDVWNQFNRGGWGGIQVVGSGE
jgi:hypothetical protein